MRFAPSLRFERGLRMSEFRFHSTIIFFPFYSSPLLFSVNHKCESGHLFPSQGFTFQNKVWTRIPCIPYEPQIDKFACPTMESLPVSSPALGNLLTTSFFFFQNPPFSSQAEFRLPFSLWAGPNLGDISFHEAALVPSSRTPDILSQPSTLNLPKLRIPLLPGLHSFYQPLPSLKSLPGLLTFIPRSAKSSFLISMSD